MPYSESTQEEVRQDAIEALEQVYDSAIPAGKRLIESLVQVTPLGIGAEKVVYDYGPNRVTCFFPNTAREDATQRLKSTYFKTKLMHLLEPDHIPDAHLVGRFPPIMVLDKVKVGDTMDLGFLKQQRSNLVDHLLSCGVEIDRNENNFLMDANGQVQYVDSFRIYRKKKLSAAIHKLPEDIRPRAERYLSRVNMNFENSWYTFGSSRAGEYVPPAQNV